MLEFEVESDSLPEEDESDSSPDDSIAAFDDDSDSLQLASLEDVDVEEDDSDSDSPEEVDSDYDPDSLDFLAGFDSNDPDSLVRVTLTLVTLSKVLHEKTLIFRKCE